MRRTWPTLAGTLLAILAATTALASIGPAEPAFPVAAGPGFHRYPDIAAQPGGTYTVVWEINDTIRSRRYGSDDVPLGSEKPVSTLDENEQTPAVAAAPDGSLVVAWKSGNASESIAAQRLAANGDKALGQITVPASLSGESGPPDVAVAADGRFVVVWATEDGGLKARRFLANGSPAPEGEVLVAPAADADGQAEPAVTIDAAGRVFIAWSDYTDTSVVRVRGYTSALAPAWAAKPVVDGAVFTQEPDLVATPEGFVVVYNLADAATRAQGRRFTGAGAPIAGPIPLGSGVGRQPHVTRGPTGGLIAGWRNDDNDGYARALRPDLSGAGDQILVAAAGESPRLAAFEGEAIAVYHQFAPLNALDVFARRMPYDTSGGATPTPTPAPTAQPPAATPVPTVPPVAKPPKPTLAAVVTLPSSKRCVSRRKFRIRLRHPRGARLKSVQVRLNGKRVATRKGKRVTAPVNLRGLPKGRFKVRITIKLVDGRTISGTRRYRTCTRNVAEGTRP